MLIIFRHALRFIFFTPGADYDTPPLRFFLRYTSRYGLSPR